MHIHILGICGTFMGGLALIARAAGHKVTGCDLNVYPPMSTQLEEQGIQLIQGYGIEQLSLNPDLYIIGNAVTRGNPLMEEILDRQLPYTSGPQWLGEHILSHRHVLTVAGTHGKTTTSSLLAWILEYAGRSPSFLIGGVPENFKISARLSTDSLYFVIEADEYDTAFFDKRSKFIHYHGRTVILNNLEYDHADIFPNLEAIETQFHHMVRTIAREGYIIYPSQSASLHRVIERGCYSDKTTFGESGDWQIRDSSPDGSEFNIYHHDKKLGRVSWSLQGQHNQHNALAALIAAHRIGIDIAQAIEALSTFQGIKRRMELKGSIRHIDIYDDFAHHPTAIETTLNGLRAKFPERRIIAVVDPHSNTMKLGAMAEKLPSSLEAADMVFCFHETQGKHRLKWEPQEVFKHFNHPFYCSQHIDELVQMVASTAKEQDIILVMSNGGFGGFHEKLLQTLENQS
ncbi:UDP-N-acetylmuramate:L-alanyl-gamma-D-glutamyl-meso-diaminopimelate ligase [Basilea psittacipulmonis]|uniref:UDP-N-acetylmuramate--L-alanyl-gamma-D-glutamyl-meso-2,6-diaminoheptandioate ligase n=1 Tax=Basilea psittacipulmonis DSM 24701 TaxID=1072685 RepID=A0A077DDU2_9BURK|nr:UDP-N-acetylmuramate:L-alanyl-gamma-D-glutamyl-meso-diaminopimelate ligase [Basilea psittacipulmonis]AIL32296.1 UDP-N-acetylmuramate:L-alanyl-gamma-D-glutamyl-meso-diaminopimelate ligase [Basilea psittacipulmonis DSM 24701]